MSFEHIRQTFEPKPMTGIPANQDEMRLLEEKDGRLRYEPAPVPHAIELSLNLPQDDDTAAQARYLWVLTDTDMPHGLELCAWARVLATGKLKHSNLTAGQYAYIGGELWFLGRDRIVINFCSGRYGARNLEDLPLMNAVIEALNADGYDVATTGRDEEDGHPSARIMIGAPEFHQSTRSKTHE